MSGELTPDLRSEMETLDGKKRLLRKERKSLPKAEEARRKQLGTLLREGNIVLGGPFDLRLDWWQEDSDDNPKTWAGTQQVLRIAEAALKGTVVAFARAPPSTTLA